MTRQVGRAGPQRGLAGGLAQDPAAQRDDQAGLLGQRDELARAEEAARRVLPADQRLEAGDAAEVEVDDRLVVQDQLLVLDRALELLAAVEALDGVDVHVVGEDRAAVGAGGLGGVHGEVGVAQQVVAGLGGGDADRGAQVQALALEHDRRGQDVEQASDQGVDVGDVEREDRELVAAQPRDGVAVAQGVAQPLAADLQQAVAGGVAERVVDALEVVEVEEGDDGGRAADERVGDALLEQRAVRAGRSASPGRRGRGSGRRAARRRAARSSSAEQGGDQPKTSASMTATVPIQEMRSLRSARARLRAAARCSAARRRVEAGARPRSWTSAARVEVAAAQQRELLPMTGRSAAKAVDGRGRLAAAVRSARARAWMRATIDRALGLDAERDAALGGRLPLERVEAVARRPRRRRTPRGGARRSSACRCRAAMPSVAAGCDDARRRRRSGGALALHSPRGGRREAPRLDRFRNPGSPW